MCTTLFDTKGVTRFTAGTALDNKTSVKLLERIGFVLEKSEDASFYKDKAGNDIVFTGGIFVYTMEKKS